MRHTLSFPPVLASVPVSAGTSSVRLMDIFEYDEVRWPTRALQQEEEEQAVSTSAASLQLPSVQWSSEAEQIVQTQLLVVAMTPASCALLEACPCCSKVVGTVHLPSNFSQESAAPPNTSSRDVAAATLYSLGEVLVCCCRGVVPPERGPAWARGVLQKLKPKTLLLIGSMQVDQYRGEADPSQDFLALLLQSTNARQHMGAGQPDAQYLPTGSVVSGLPAALLTLAELHGLAADLIVALETVPALVPETLQDLSNVMAKVLGRTLTANAGQALAHELQATQVLEQARSKLHRTICRPNSLYS